MFFDVYNYLIKRQQNSNKQFYHKEEQGKLTLLFLQVAFLRQWIEQLV